MTWVWSLFGEEQGQLNYHAQRWGLGGLYLYSATDALGMEDAGT